MFTTFLRYKLEEQGKKLVKVGRFFASSQTCSVCGYKNAKTKDLALREWDCPQCGNLSLIHIFNIFTNLFIGISLGANVLAARFYASGKEKEMSETVRCV